LTIFLKLHAITYNSSMSNLGEISPLKFLSINPQIKHVNYCLEKLIIKKKNVFKTTGRLKTVCKTHGMV